MHRDTIDLYEREAKRYRARRTASGIERAEAVGAAAGGGPVLDAGCGPGIYTGALGPSPVGLDAARAMLDIARGAVPAGAYVRGDLGALPFRDAAFAGAWARQSYLHVPRSALPAALADLHRVLNVSAPVSLTMLAAPPGGGSDGFVPEGDDFPGRFFAAWDEGSLADVVEGAGFDRADVHTDGQKVVVEARRGRTLADSVGPGMRVLVCGLNPSLHAADAGVGYAGPGNRFWPAAIAAGLVARDRDPASALRAGVGMTDLVKRATMRASEVDRGEYRRGAQRVERLVRWLRPGAVCFVGLAGYRSALDRTARAGWQAHRFGGVPTYVMPSTSGLNAASSLDDLAGHLRAVASGGPDGSQW